jgi:demethylmenaquinone methyltransferase/2-methoxy-6-polyprenyl-1,4-benzoquinol methylase
MDLEKKVVKPYNTVDKSKKEEVQEMFNNISKRYDLLNHLLSIGIDKSWRKKAVRTLRDSKPKNILDIATGTGDFALALLHLHPEKITGLDLSEGMLEIAKEKIAQKKYSDKIIFLQGDSENLPFENTSFDAITVGFGVRNFENLEKGLAEIFRVLKPNGYVAILEFSKPKKFPMKQAFGFYSKFIIPSVGKMLSKDTAAYSYLPDSVAAFPEGKAFLEIMQKVGFSNLSAYPLTGGIATIYNGKK